MKQKSTSQSMGQNRQTKKHQMVAVTHKKNKELGTFETINDIFYRLPLPRLQKNNYKFLFDNIKENVEIILEHQNRITEIQKVQQELIDSMEVKLVRPGNLPTEAELNKEKLNSGGSLFQSLVFLRFQDKKDYGFNKFQGNMQPFLIQSHYIQLQKLKKQIPNLKLFLQSQPPIKRQQFCFTSQNELLFKNKSFPSSYQFNKRAQILAKLYLLDLYRQESRKLLSMDRHDQSQQQKKRQINKIKQQMDIQKMKEGELIQDMDLLKQVYKILDWIEKKMNSMAYEEFYKNKNGDRATQIKKSLEKLKTIVNTEPVAMNKLKILINYKYKKGF